jgi:hypothetical protein
VRAEDYPSLGKRLYSKEQKGHKKGAECALFAPSMVSRNCANHFGMNGGDDETRTRDLCRDSVLSATYILAGAAKSLEGTVGTVPSG